MSRRKESGGLRRFLTGLGARHGATLGGVLLGVIKDEAEHQLPERFRPLGGAVVDTAGAALTAWLAGGTLSLEAREILVHALATAEPSRLDEAAQLIGRARELAARARAPR